MIVFAFWAPNNDNRFEIRFLRYFVGASVAAFPSFPIFFDFCGARENQIVSWDNFRINSQNGLNLGSILTLACLQNCLLWFKSVAKTLKLFLLATLHRLVARIPLWIFKIRLFFGVVWFSYSSMHFLVSSLFTTLGENSISHWRALGNRQWPAGAGDHKYSFPGTSITREVYIFLVRTHIHICFKFLSYLLKLYRIKAFFELYKQSYSCCL